MEKPLREATIKECIQIGTQALIAVSDTARLDVEVLLAFILKKERSFFFAWPETTLNSDHHEEFQRLLSRRVSGEPIAYIVGEREFWSLNFYTSPATLIPRPDTEILVEQLISLMPEHPVNVLDLGTGTGAIAIAVAKERPDCSVHAIECSDDALALAQKNCDRHKIENLVILKSDWFSEVTSTYDFIVSNPPYIDADDPHLKQGDVVCEPASALIAKDNGLADLKKIICSASTYLKSGGWLLVEHGWRQGSDVRDIFFENKFSNVKTEKDYSSNERVTLGQTHE